MPKKNIAIGVLEDNIKRTKNTIKWGKENHKEYTKEVNLYSRMVESCEAHVIALEEAIRKLKEVK